MASFGRYGFAWDWRRKAAVLAMLAVLQQALVFALLTPALALPGSSDSQILAAICGAHAPGQPTHAPVADCQICPLCQALAAAGLAAPPQPALLARLAVSPLRHLVAPSLPPRAGSVAQAAQPRGPPPLPSHV